ncbi:MAG: c-type cytochrome [Flavobacterium sp.]|nr:c-type cytochrome [Flavobacterium sp.]
MNRFSLKNSIILCVSLVLVCIILSCNRSTSSSIEKAIDRESSTDESAAMSQLMSAEELLSANDCAACHHEKESVIGPSYSQIAKRYSITDIPQLTEKIIKGGKGNWGETPMTAHPGLSQDEATVILTYILSMK